MRLLIVKTSSLGDVIHALPAVTDAGGRIPQLRCDWLVARAFAEIPVWHPAVDRALRCDMRGWRNHPWQHVAGVDWSRFILFLRTLPYDLILDALGLVLSAWLAR